MTDNEQYEQKLNDDINIITLSISIFGCLLVLSIVFVFRILKLPSAERLSFKLSFWVALSDLLFGISFIFPYIIDRLASEEYYINIIVNYPIVVYINSTVPTLMTIWYVALTSSMALNLHWTFLTRSKYRYLLTEFNLVFITLLFSCLVILPGLILSIVYEKLAIFDFYPDGPIKTLIFWAQFDLWLTLGIAYNSIIIIQILIVFYRYNQFIKSVDPSIIIRLPNHSLPPLRLNQHQEQEEGQVLIHSNEMSKDSRLLTVLNPFTPPMITNRVLDKKLLFIAIRVSGYAIIPIITQSLFIVVSTYYVSTGDRRNFPLRVLYDQLSFLNGILNSIVFCFDPALSDCWNQFIMLYWKKQKNVELPNNNELKL